MPVARPVIYDVPCSDLFIFLSPRLIAFGHFHLSSGFCAAGSHPIFLWSGRVSAFFFFQVHKILATGLNNDNTIGPQPIHVTEYVMFTRKCLRYDMSICVKTTTSSFQTFNSQIQKQLSQLLNFPKAKFL